MIKGMAGIHEREGFPSSLNLKALFVEEYFEGLISLWPMGQDTSAPLLNSVQRPEQDPGRPTLNQHLPLLQVRRTEPRLPEPMTAPVGRAQVFAQRCFSWDNKGIPKAHTKAPHTKPHPSVCHQQCQHQGNQSPEQYRSGPGL